MQSTLTCLTLLSWEVKCHIQRKPISTTPPNLLPPQFPGVTTLTNLLFITHRFISLYNMQYGLAFLTLHQWYQSECIVLWLACWILCFQYIIFIELVGLQHCVSFQCTAKWFSYTYIYFFHILFCFYYRMLNIVSCVIQ